MRVTLLARRYAKALFELALENKQLEQVAADMELVGSVVGESRELKLLLNNPVIDVHKKLKVLEKLFAERLGELSLRFLLLITRKGREKYIPYITKAFSKIYKDYNNVVEVNLTTAFKADKATKESLLKMMARITDRDVELHEDIDKDVIGGFMINLEDYQYDATVRTQLKRLRKEFSKNLYIKKY